MKTKFSTFLAGLSFLLLPVFGYANNGDFCAAFRGNAEYAPGPWGGVTKLIEDRGMPAVTAGGSSASVTVLFLTSMAANPKFKNLSKEEQKKKMGLLVKSMPAFFQKMGEMDGILGLYSELNGVSGKDQGSGIMGRVSKISQVLKAMKTDPSKSEIQSLNDTIEKYLPLINPELKAGLTNPLTFSFYRERLNEALAVFGKFKVEGDQNLFFRSGLVDFKYISLLMGTVADFYAGNDDKNPAVNENLAKYVNGECSNELYKKEWNLQGQCEKQFAELVGSYLKGRSAISDFPNKRIFENVGDGKDSLTEGVVTTGYMDGNSADRFTQLRSNFVKGKNLGPKSPYDLFTVDYNDLHFGYYGNTASLQAIQQKLNTDERFINDEKSKKFRALGDESFFAALSSSTGEPGLTNFQPLVKMNQHTVEGRRKAALSQLQFTNSWKDRWKSFQSDNSQINMGGWSDLHPTAVLASHPACQGRDIIYVNREGGEGCFAQTLFLRVIAGEREKVPFWDQMCSNPNFKDYSNEPGSNLADSYWNKLYHSGNPYSSYNLAVHLSNPVVCATWDSLNSPFTGVSIFDHFKNGYEAPIYDLKDRSVKTLPAGCQSPLDHMPPISGPASLSSKSAISAD